MGCGFRGPWISRAPRRAAGDQSTGFRSERRTGRRGRATSAVRPRAILSDRDNKAEAVSTLELARLFCISRVIATNSSRCRDSGSIL